VSASPDVDGRVVIVTGASSGIGAWVTTGLAAAGAQVVCTARRGDRLEQLIADIPNALAVAGDLTSDDDRARIVAATIEKFGRVDGLVNNAGATHTIPALKETADDVRALLEIDLVAPLDLARRCAISMRETGGGSIVNVTSMSGVVTTGQTVPNVGYCAAKAGLAHATREQAVQWARYGIRVNSVAPGMFPTEMVDGREEVPDFLLSRLLVKRVGSAEDIVGAVQYLLSDASSYITGQQLVVDGGRTIT
jgi:NAD(P)-dependent dehydrogenase (short-subunit alcohol dehydrogenase family)